MPCLPTGKEAMTHNIIVKVSTKDFKGLIITPADQRIADCERPEGQ
jgi:hypothetical protein